MNLLPNDIKKQLRREYRLRFSALLTLAAFFSILFGVVASAPFVVPVLSDYMLAREEKKDIELFKPNDNDQRMLLEFQTLKDMLNVLDPQKTNKGLVLSELIALVMREKPDSVSLNGFLLNVNDSAKLFQVSGVAADRESLVAFSRRLSSNSAFFSVDFPLSNLSKKEDIGFSMNAVVATTSQKTEGASVEGQKSNEP